MSSRGVKRDRTPFEIGVLAVSLLSVASILAGLLLAGASGSKGPPDLRVSVAPTPANLSGGLVYALTVRNDGGETAANVVVEVRLGGETREIEIVSVAKGDEEEVSAVFPPGTTGTPSATVVSYHRATRD